MGKLKNADRRYFVDVGLIDVNIAERKIIFSLQCYDFGLEYLKPEQHPLIFEKNDI